MYSFVGPLDFDDPPNFIEIRQRIEDQGKHMLTLGELICLFNRVDSDSDEQVVNVLKYNFIFSNTGMLWTPAKVYVKDDPDIEDGQLQMDEVEFDIGLEHDDDPSIRCLSTEKLDEHCGSQPHDALAGNPYVVLQAGEEGAVQLAQVAANREQGAYITYLPEPRPKIIALSLGGISSVQRIFDRITVGCLDATARGFGVAAENSDGTT